ncbi:MAG: hypothetical protein HWD58_13680 [Bacteroidota bacterium]|nr:MAG: hypothetical protein HWD58_13680 [Bacteroidota bacterium]
MLKKLATCFLMGTMFLCTSLKAQELMRYNTLRRLSWEADEAKRNQLYQQALTTYADYLKAELATNQYTSFLVQEAVFHQLVCALHLKKIGPNFSSLNFLNKRLTTYSGTMVNMSWPGMPFELKIMPKLFDFTIGRYTLFR